MKTQNPPVYKIMVIEQVTERVWYEITGVDSIKAAIVAYREGEGIETGRKHLSTDSFTIEDVYQEKQNND